MSAGTRLRDLWHHVPLPVRDLIWDVRLGAMTQYRRRRTEIAVRLAPRLRAPAGPSPPFTLLCIYRDRNIAHVVDLCRSARAAGGAVRLWSLDGSTHPELADHTVGSSAGDRTALLNRLERSAPTEPDHWIVVSDDDVHLGAEVARLISIAVAAGFDIAQPAHGARSHASFPHTFAKPLSVARRTEFVEVGPVVVFSPRARGEVFPMDEAPTMGLGSELAWMDLREIGIELGIIDCVAVEHLAPPGRDYDASLDDILAMIDAAGGQRRLRTVYGTWYPYRRRPPWASTTS